VTQQDTTGCHTRSETPPSSQAPRPLTCFVVEQSCVAQVVGHHYTGVQAGKVKRGHRLLVEACVDSNHTAAAAAATVAAAAVSSTTATVERG
jgi:hypothetical protein